MSAYLNKLIESVKRELEQERTRVEGAYVLHEGN